MKHMPAAVESILLALPSQIFIVRVRKNCYVVPRPANKRFLLQRSSVPVNPNLKIKARVMSCISKFIVQVKSK